MLLDLTAISFQRYRRVSSNIFGWNGSVSSRLKRYGGSNSLTSSAYFLPRDGCRSSRSFFLLDARAESLWGGQPCPADVPLSAAAHDLKSLLATCACAWQFHFKSMTRKRRRFWTRKIAEFYTGLRIAWNNLANCHPRCFYLLLIRHILLTRIRFNRIKSRELLGEHPSARTQFLATFRAKIRKSWKDILYNHAIAIVRLVSTR